MAEYEISCVTKAHGANALGKITREDAAKRIGPTGSDKMYVQKPGTSKTYLRANKTANGVAFVETVGNQTDADNLWNLTPCP